MILLLKSSAETFNDDHPQKIVICVNLVWAEYYFAIVGVEESEN